MLTPGLGSEFGHGVIEPLYCLDAMRDVGEGLHIPTCFYWLIGELSPIFGDGLVDHAAAVAG